MSNTEWLINSSIKIIFICEISLPRKQGIFTGQQSGPTPSSYLSKKKKRKKKSLLTEWPKEIKLEVMKEFTPQTYAA